MSETPPARATWALSVLVKIAWRYLRFHRWQSLLMVLGIALGVAVVVSIDLANASAGRAFELSTETVAGKTTHQVQSQRNGVAEELYRNMRKEQVVDLATPVISEYVTSPQIGSQPLQLLGIDPFSDSPFRSFLGQANTVNLPDLANLSGFFTRPGAVLISKNIASQYKLNPGDEIDLIVGGYTRKVFIAGILVPVDTLSRRTLDGLILADISTAQEITGMIGLFSRIDLILPDDDPRAVQRLSSWLPSGYQLVSSTAQTSTIQQMTAAFKLNLSALSLLALVVGLFLIYNTMTFSVVQRRAFFGTLRCLGVTRQEIFLMVVGEAFLIGLLGGLFGIVLGLVLGRFTVSMVTQTVNDLYFATTVRDVGIDPLSLLKGGLLGVITSLVTAAFPALEAASVPPRAALLRSGLESKARSSVGTAGILGFLIGVLGIALFFFPTRSLLVGFGGTLLVVFGFALLSSMSLVLLMRGFVPLTGRLFGFIGRMAPRNLVNALSRTAVAVAALMVSVAVTIGVSLMIDSFRTTVVTWLEQTLQSDVYVSVPGFNATHATAVIDSRVVDIVHSWSAIDRVDALRTISVGSQIGRVNLSATDNVQLGNERIFLSLVGQREDIWKSMMSGAVLVSEPFANRLGLHQAGGSIWLDTLQGRKSFPVIGIYADYASSEGTVMMAMDVYRTIWQDTTITALGLHLKPGLDPDAVSAELQPHLQQIQQVLVRPNQALRKDVMEVFDRTFAITVALRLQATVVAFIGILNALLLLQFEKQREVGILRALGLTGRQLWQLVMVETGLMGFAAGLLALPTGYALAVILVYVINRRSFGWTLQLSVTPQIFLQALAVAVVAALVAGIIPAYKLSRMSAAEVIRNE